MPLTPRPLIGCSFLNPIACVLTSPHGPGVGQILGCCPFLYPILLSEQYVPHQFTRAKEIDVVNLTVGIHVKEVEVTRDTVQVKNRCETDAASADTRSDKLVANNRVLTDFRPFYRPANG